MLGRRAPKVVAACTAAVVVALAFVLVGSWAFTQEAHAGTGPGASGNTITDAAQAQTPFSPGTFDSGQPIDVVVPANSVLTPGATIFVLECAAPNGVNPTSTAACDGNTGYAGGTISVQSDGSVDVINTSTSSGFPYNIYALPDQPTFEENPTGAPKCGLGSANECVLYIGQGGGGDTGFSLPHFFSQAFQVHPDSTDSGTLNPGDGTFPADSAPAITSANNTTFTQGSAGSFSVTATGWPPPTFAETGALPSGVTLNSSTGALSGTTSSFGSFPISITASNGIGSPATQSFTLTVQAGVSGDNIPGAAAAQSPFSPGTFDSGQPIDVVVPPNSVLTPGARIEVLECAAPGGVDPTSTAACDGNTAYAGGTITVNNDGSIDVVNGSSASGQSYTVYALPDRPTFGESSAGFPRCGQGSANECVLYIGQGGGGDTGFSLPHFFSQAFQVHPDSTDSGTLNPGGGTFPADSAPAITSANNTTFTKGTAGSFTVTATGYGPPTFAETGALPSGVTLNSSSGALSGTPTQGGVYPITITANNGVSPAATQSFTLTVNAPPAITSANSTTFTEGTAGSFTVTDTGTPSPTLGESGTLPNGVTFNSSTGALSGTPTQAGMFPITFTATNGIGSPASQSFTLTVDAAPAITSANHATFTQGTAGSFTVTVTGTPTPTLGESGTLPNGVTFTSSTGKLSGTPTQSGTFPITFTATNGVGSPAGQSFTLTVNTSGVAPAITSANSTTFVEGNANTFTVSATGNPKPTLVESGALPAGVTFTPSTGALSGTPTVAGTFPITFTATNGVNPPASQSFTLTVVAMKITTTSLPTAHIGQAYNAQLQATGGLPPYKWKKVSTLPKGLKLNASSGQIAGTVSAKVAPGNYSVTVMVSDHTKHVHNTAQATFTLTVAP